MKWVLVNNNLFIFCFNNLFFWKVWAILWVAAYVCVSPNATAVLLQITFYRKSKLPFKFRCIWFILSGSCTLRSSLKQPAISGVTLRDLSVTLKSRIFWPKHPNGDALQTSLEYYSHSIGARNATPLHILFKANSDVYGKSFRKGTGLIEIT